MKIPPIPEELLKNPQIRQFFLLLRESVNGSLDAESYTTTQRDSITSWKSGKIIFNSTTNNYEGYKTGTGWVTLG